jgi:iron complex transport system ATP-binding protein
MKLCIKHAEYHYDLEKNNGFKDISFDLDQPGVMSILGPNGCGKTTLLKCIDGLMKLNGGSISINGKDLSELSRVEIAKSVGYVPQFHQPSFAFSVLDAVLVGRAPHIGFLDSPKKEDILIAKDKWFLSLESWPNSHHFFCLMNRLHIWILETKLNC